MADGTGEGRGRALTYAVRRVRWRRDRVRVRGPAGRRRGRSRPSRPGGGAARRARVIGVRGKDTQIRRRPPPQYTTCVTGTGARERAIIAERRGAVDGNHRGPRAPAVDDFHTIRIRRIHNGRANQRTALCPRAGPPAAARAIDRLAATTQPQKYTHENTRSHRLQPRATERLYHATRSTRTLHTTTAPPAGSGGHQATAHT